MEKLDLLTNLLTPEENTIVESYVENLTVNYTSETYKGRHLIPNTGTAVVEYVNNKMNIKNGDVFIATYPKTGTNWMVEIIRMILYSQDQAMLVLARALPLTLRYLERDHDIRKFSIFEKYPFKRRLFFTHLTPELINFEKLKRANAKIVYVFRNPKDQIVSWYNFLKNTPLGKFKPFKSMMENGWDEYVNHVLAGHFYMNVKDEEWYPEHILSWYPHRDNKSVYFVAYEDLKKDTFHEIKELSKFLEVFFNDETVAKIADACGFENMKKTITETNFKEDKIMRLMRKGEVGGWKDYFTVSQSERVDAIMDEKLKNTDIKFTYELQ